ncbi:chondroitin AC/alginate lyase [Cyathus striatus]|nr:chondroitin AC/alginate lyase [Cyathus striatus]
MSPTLLRTLLAVSCLFTTVIAQTSYANDFLDPAFIVSKEYGNNTLAAQETVVKWADTLAAQGPWSVMTKQGIAPSGDMHDYLSWAPYWWPNCTGVGNTTELTPEQIWTTCPYYVRDGLFNPDVRFVNDVGNFQNMSDAVFYNAIASTMGNTSYGTNVVKFISTWFLDADTKMNPNLNYGQVQRGPGVQSGSHTGVLDLKSMTKVVSAVLILRRSRHPGWTSDIDSQLIAWTQEYITWLETASIALEEGAATNNHGTFYYNQLAALKILVNDLDGAKNVTDTYFSKQYLAQIEASGEQPLEAARTRPYHYRAYNLAAMITNARLAKYADPSSTVWNTTTSAGATIKTALDFAMGISASTSNETDYASELYPSVAAVAAVYSDPDGKYLTFLQGAEPDFAEDPYFLWDQPWALDLDVSNLVNSSGSTSNVKNGAGRSVGLGALGVGLAGVICALLV